MVLFTWLILVLAHKPLIVIHENVLAFPITFLINHLSEIYEYSFKVLEP